VGGLGQAPSGLRKAGVLWVKRKEDKGWVRHFVVATGHSLEWLAMDGKLVCNTHTTHARTTHTHGTQHTTQHTHAH
jgi:hypothetical protein